jgi:hypothetical protein
VTTTNTPLPRQGAITIPEAAASREHHSLEAIDQAVDDVAARADAWTRTSIADRRRLLDQMVHDTLAVAEDWSLAAARAKGLDPWTPAGAEDVATGPVQLVRLLRLLDRTLANLERTGEVGLPKEPWIRDDGQVVVPVFPTSRLDAATFVGHKAEVWLRPEVTHPSAMRTATNYREQQTGRVAFVLGAGNVSSAGPADVLHKLYAEDQVCVLKLNPVNEHLGEYLEVAMQPLVREGFVRVVYGGAKEGQHLVDHPRVDTIHMTASDKTHDAIVFGLGEEGEQRKRERRPRIDKEVTSELGSVSPLIVVPGPWSDEDLAYQGQHIASMLTFNAGFTCACPRMIVTHGAWNRRQALLDRLRDSLRSIEPKHPWYPGARERWEVFTQAHPEAERFGPEDEACVPWTLIPDLDPSIADDVAFQVEAFNGVIGEVGLDAPLDAAAFLDAATDFANERLWGTLSATILVHPRSLKDPSVATALDRAIARLRYGTVAVNVWAATGYGLVSTPWGAAPGHPLHDIQSGRGWVHNTYFLDDAQKSVVRAPFRLGKKPPMSADFTTFPSLARRLLQVEAQADWRQLPGIVVDGIRA